MIAIVHLRDEVTKNIKKPKFPGKDGIQREILKRLDKETVSRIHSVVEMVWKVGHG